MSDSQSTGMRRRRAVVMLSDTEKTLLDERAARVGLTVSGYLRTIFLEHDGPPPVPAKQMAEAS